MTEDIKIKCGDCGKDFVFSVQEQRFYIDRGFTNPDGSPRQPKRCRNCRRQRRNEGVDARREARGNRGVPDFPHRGSR